MPDCPGPDHRAPGPPWRGAPWRDGPWGRPGPPPGIVRRVAIGAVVGVVVLVTVLVALVLGLARATAELGPGVTLGVAAVALAGLVAGVSVLGRRAARRWARPVEDVMAAADRLAAGDLEARVRVGGAPPMRRLAGSFNAMADRLATDEHRRRELLADIAHELRTPLTAVRGTAEAIVDGVRPLDPGELEVVVERTRAMDRLLDDLATLSTAEAGALRLHPEPVALRPAAERAVAAFGVAAAEAGVALEVRVAPGAPAEVEADPLRLDQVLGTLLDNAVRHTPAGGRVEVAVAPGAAAHVVLTVSDTGPGVAPDDLPHVFDRFVKAADSGGSGLGLAIARRLVEAHGGRIAARSPGDLGAGTTIQVVLPG